MRLSNDPDDEAFNPEKCRKYRVTLDGVGVSWITADDVLGEAKVMAMNAKGNADINPGTGHPWYIWRTGTVQFFQDH